MSHVLRWFAVAVLVVLPCAVRACPFCADSVPNQSSAEAEDAKREAQAYNASIYLMAGTPYLLLGGVGFWVYRSLKRKAAADADDTQ